MSTRSQKRWLFLFAGVALILGSCGGGASDELVDGGLLYDNWWVTADLAEPTGDQVLWATQSTNEREGLDTYRCKECHGWDYKGAEGAYGSGSHFTGFPGIMQAADKTSEEITTALTSGDHDFASLGEDQIANLVTFIQDGLVDYGPYIDSDTKAIVGADIDHGEGLFTGLCLGCHGSDGQTLNFGSEDEPEYLGDLARDNPWEAFHKARYGHPGSDPVMPSTLQEGWSIEDVRDVISYAQTVGE